jgi:hypothetical protein
VTGHRSRSNVAASGATTDLATAARTAIAATHGGRLLLPGPISEDVGFLDDDGEPLLVVFGFGPVPNGRACLSVAVGPQARVVLGGRLHAVGSAGGDVIALLGAHAPCFEDTLASGPVQMVRLAVDEIRFEEGRTSTIVSAADYAAAEPDLWAAFAVTVAEHLDSDHADVLTELARLHVPGHTVVATGIAELQPGVLTLDVVTPGSASRLRLPLHVRLDDPHELCGRLIEIAAPLTANERPGAAG